MTYILEDLLNIRKHRERSALHHLLLVIKEVEIAQSEREEKSKALQSYIQWRGKEEVRLFEKLKHETRTIHDLLNYNLQIEDLMERQNQLQKALHQAEEAVEKAMEKQEASRREYAYAHRAVEKLAIHKEFWLREKYMNDERREENDQDEINSNRRNMSPVF